MQPVQLLITLKRDGKVEVTGPIQNKLVAYGMLEMARDAIKDYKPAVIEIPQGE